MIKNIQTLRLVAALLVFIFHLQGFLFAGTAPPAWFRALGGMGFFGVDIFFVISGAIMAHTTRGMAPGWRSAGYFVGVRFSRIYVGWWPLFAVYLVHALSSPEGLRPGVNLPGSFLLYPINLFTSLLPVTWTLSFELYFYLMVAMALWWGRCHAAYLLGAVAIVSSLCTLYFWWRGAYLPAYLPYVGFAQAFAANPLVIEFVAGFLLCEWLHKQPNPGEHAGLAGRAFAWFAGAAACYALALYYQTHGHLHGGGLTDLFHAPERTILLGGCACCLVGGAMVLERQGIAPWPTLQKLGDASYALYLVHILAIALVAQGFERFNAQLQLPRAVWALVAIAVCLGCAQMYYTLYEAPVHKWIKRRFTYQQAKKCDSGTQLHG